MSDIRVINKHRETARIPELLIQVMRPSVLGNPFKVFKGPSSRSSRDDAVARFEKHLRWKMQYENEVRREIMRLAALVLNGERLALECCCAPKRCHADIIKIIIEEVIKEKTP